jgi:hypothetical protein
MRDNERKPLVEHIYTADPSAHVFDGKIYIYPSHDMDIDMEEDDDGEQYRMEDYHVLSMDSLDSPCVDNGVALHEKDVPWVSRQMWAPDAVKVNDKYYLVFPAKDKDDIFRIGVAVSDSPVGPFVAQENYIQGSYSIDPAVLLDDDGRIYCYNGGLWVDSSRCGSQESLIQMRDVQKVMISHLAQFLLSLTRILQHLRLHLR